MNLSSQALVGPKPSEDLDFVRHSRSFHFSLSAD